MKIFCITDNIELELGLKLVGCDGETLKNKETIEQKIDEILKLKEIEVLVISNKNYELVKEKIDYIRLNYRLPLITVV